MNAMSTSAPGVRELEIMSLAVNYHRWTYATVRPYIGKRVLEVGGGFGSISCHLVGSQRLVIIDSDPVCARHLTSRFGGLKGVSIVEADILDPSLPGQLADERLDTIVCINVLEHIEDDFRALRQMHQALEPGGNLILLVPAHPRLYGTLDELVGHFRRYRSWELRKKIADVGFIVHHCRYFNSLGAVGRYVIGRLREQQETGVGQVRFFDRYLVPLLSRVERVIPPPFGQSLIIIGRKYSPYVA
jgi:SAM-dependent methyltransferase